MKPRHTPLPDAQLIRMIAARALAAPLAVRISRVELRAAITAAHAAQPFNLRALLSAGDHTFFDRVLGIHRAHRPEKCVAVFGPADAQNETAARGQPEAAPAEKDAA